MSKITTPKLSSLMPIQARRYFMATSLAMHVGRQIITNTAFDDNPHPPPHKEAAKARLVSRLANSFTKLWQLRKFFILKKRAITQRASRLRGIKSVNIINVRGQKERTFSH